MKSALRIFLISLIASLSLIICSCGQGSTGDGGSIGDPGNRDGQDGGDGHGSGGSKSSESLDIKTVKFTVSGITCQTCNIEVVGLLKACDGIKTAEAFFDRVKKNVIVTYDPKKLTVKDIEKVINDSGRDVTETET